MTVALIVAAGSGERLGAGQPKALVELAGRPLLQWSIDALLEVSGIERVIVALPAGVALPCGADGCADADAGERVFAVEGGATRSQSVRLALDAAGASPAQAHARREGESDLVLVHDAARPLVSAALAETVIAALAHEPEADAAIAAVPVTDTIKRVDTAGAVLETLDRSELWAVQTPQVFRRLALERALDVPVQELARATDDAGLLERSGSRVIVVRASEENLKVTTPLDLRVAELLLAGRSRSPGEQRNDLPNPA
ncbi:MAG TPA: 2-C-methyl-D-erythritol 4-phosphate cytidylyltransferase [Solirubrobacteraceae bacterium]|nr:2-C-methyl-D-erythritol 4-phosphate cytidylyltransferase [Solirubrobacteraceae bacterium]